MVRLRSFDNHLVNIKQGQNSVDSQQTRKSKYAHTESGLLSCWPAAAARPWATGCEGRHLVNTGATSVKLLGLWSGVCVGGTRSWVIVHWICCSITRQKTQTKQTDDTCWQFSRELLINESPVWWFISTSRNSEKVIEEFAVNFFGKFGTNWQWIRFGLVQNPDFFL